MGGNPIGMEQEALYDPGVMRQFVGVNLAQEPVPDVTTVCKFRYLLEEHHLGGELSQAVNLYLQSYGGEDHEGHDRGKPSSSTHLVRPRIASRNVTLRCTKRKRASSRTSG
jgi:hypothetical protein